MMLSVADKYVLGFRKQKLQIPNKDIYLNVAGEKHDRDGSLIDKLVLICLLYYLGLKLTAYLLDKFNDYVNGRYSDELQFCIETVMMEKTSRMDLAFFDSAKMGDKVRHARSNFNIMTNMT